MTTEDKQLLLVDACVELVLKLDNSEYKNTITEVKQQDYGRNKFK